MPDNPPKITPIDLITALLIIAFLAAIAIPRLREASRVEGAGEVRVLATFGGDVRDSAGGAAVSCGSCEDHSP